MQCEWPPGGIHYALQVYKREWLQACGTSGINSINLVVGGGKLDTLGRSEPKLLCKNPAKEWPLEKKGPEPRNIFHVTRRAYSCISSRVIRSQVELVGKFRANGQIDGF